MRETSSIAVTPVEVIEKDDEHMDLYSEEDRQKDEEILKDIEKGLQWHIVAGN